PPRGSGLATARIPFFGENFRESRRDRSPLPVSNGIARYASPASSKNSLSFSPLGVGQKYKSIIRYSRMRSALSRQHFHFDLGAQRQFADRHRRARRIRRGAVFAVDRVRLRARTGQPARQDAGCWWLVVACGDPLWCEARTSAAGAALGRPGTATSYPQALP